MDDVAEETPAKAQVETPTRRDFLVRTGAAIGAAGAGTLLAQVPALAAPAAARPIGAARKGGALTVGVVGDLANFDAFNLFQVNYPYIENLYDQLMRLDNSGVAHPALVLDRRYSDGGRTMTLKLRKGVTYHNGDVFTAADVVSNIQRARDAKTGGNMLANMATVTGAKATAADTVVVSFSAPTAYTDDILGLLPAIDPKGYAGLKSKPAGTGPFKLAQWVPNDHYTLERNGSYWDPTRPLLDTVTFKVYADDNAMISALQGGLLDVAVAVPPRNYDQFKSQFSFAKGQKAAEFYYLGLSAKVAPFNNRLVRQAMAYAMDRATMAKTVLYGLSGPTYTPFPSFSPAYFPEYNARFTYNLAMAKSLLAQAGHASGFEFTVPTPNNFPELGLFAQILQADLAKIGVKMNIQPMDPASWYPILVNGTYQATFSFAGGSQIYPTRITLSGNFSGSHNVAWPGGTPPAAYSAAITAADTTIDPAKQRAAFKQMVDSYVTESWNIPIAFRTTLFALKPNVKGFGWDVYNQPRFAGVSLG